jgi:hypothetical protein
MKHNSLLIQTALALSVALLGTACASKNEGGFATTSNPVTVPTGGTGTIPDTNTNTGTNSGSDYWANDPGASATLTVDSLAVLNSYVASHPINSPSNIRVYLNLSDVGGGRYGGTVKIGYYDNNQLYTGVFSTDNPTGYNYNRVSYKNWYVGKPNAEFNQWFNWNGKQVFHGFFQDKYGAIVVVIDGGLDLGDGGGMTEVSGSIWFKNFQMARADQYMGGYGEMCWFLLPPSPYECGTFKSGEQVVTTSALYPAGYTRLGTFSGVNKSRAFR